MADAPPPEQEPQARQVQRQPINFSLTPANANPDILDYSSKAGYSIWTSGTAPLSNDLFDCNPDGLCDFLELVDHRSTVMGWKNNLLGIPQDINDPMAKWTDFISSYGTIDLEHLQRYARTYAGQPSRVAQDSMMLYTCLHASLSRVGRNKVTIYAKEYTIDEFKDGVLFLKIIIRQSSIDTNATTASIRNQLADIGTYLATVNFDITKMNKRVNLLLEALQARGGTTHDLLNNLFRAYRTVKDREFIRYMTQKESNFKEGTIELNASKLMLLAENKFKTLTEKGEWQAPSAEEEKIVALRAELEALKRKRDGNKGQQNQSGKHNARRGKRDRDKSNRKDNEARRRNRQAPEWVNQLPKPGEPTQKEVDGKTWYVCEHHKKWCLHRTEDCKKKGLENNKGPGKKQAENKRALRANKATVRWSDIENEDDSSKE